MRISDGLYSVFEAVCMPTSRWFVMISGVSLEGNASKAKRDFAGLFS